MKVYIVQKGEYEDRDISGVYASLEAAKAAHPLAHNGKWVDAGAHLVRVSANLTAAWYADYGSKWPFGENIFIEEHELDGWATGGKVETYDDWKVRQGALRRTSVDAS